MTETARCSSMASVGITPMPAVSPQPPQPPTLPTPWAELAVHYTKEEIEDARALSLRPTCVAYRTLLSKLMRFADTIFGDAIVLKMTDAGLATEYVVGLDDGRHSGAHIVQYLGSIEDSMHEVAALPPLMLGVRGGADTALAQRGHILNDVALDALRRMPAFEVTGSARIVAVPVLLKYLHGAHANMLVIDRKHKQAILVDSNSGSNAEARERLQVLLREHMGSITLHTGMRYAKYQYYSVTCATWAGFLGAQIIREAVQEDVSVLRAAAALDVVYAQERHKQASSIEAASTGASQYASVRVNQSLDNVAKLLAVARGARLLQHLRPGGTLPGTVKHEVAPDLVARDAYHCAHMILQYALARLEIPPEVAEEVEGTDDDLSKQRQEAIEAVKEWLVIMHSRPRCMQMRGTSAGFFLLPGFSTEVGAEASQSSRAWLQQKVFGRTMRGLVRIVSDKVKVFASDTPAEKLGQMPTLPAAALTQPFRPSHAGNEIAKAIGLSEDVLSIGDVYGQAA